MDAALVTTHTDGERNEHSTAIPTFSANELSSCLSSSAQSIYESQKDSLKSRKSHDLTTSKTYTHDEVASHCTPASAWVIYQDKVFDISEYLKSGIHPGGNSILLDYAGKNISKAFDQIGHSSQAYEELLFYQIGVVSSHPERHHLKNGETGVKESQIKLITDLSQTYEGVDFRKPLISQVYDLDREGYSRFIKHMFIGNTVCRFFENPFLEQLSRATWYMVPMLWLPVIFAMEAENLKLAYLSPPTLILYYAMGFSIWTFAEYLIHRYIFHLPENRLPDLSLFRLFHFLVHEVHHLLVADRYRLVLPPALAFLYGIPFYSCSRIIFPRWFAHAVWPGVITGYVLYDLIHYSLHHAELTCIPYLQFAKRYHSQHHYKNPDKGFGVSSPFWDYVFGTQLEVANVKFE